MRGAALVVVALALWLAGARGLAAVWVVATLPLWLPDTVVALRNWIFTAINGDEGMLFPDATVSGKVWGSFCRLVVAVVEAPSTQRTGFNRILSGCTTMLR